MRNFLSLILFSCFSLAHAQVKCVALTPKYDTVWAAIGEPQAYEVIRQFDFSKSENNSVTFYLGDTSYAFVNCRSDWFEYSNGVWINKYELHNHGFTCHPVVFLESGKPHIYGGYGIWRGQSLNIKLGDNGEWDAVVSRSTPENYRPAIGFEYKDSSRVLLGGITVNTLRDINYSTPTGFVVSQSGDWTPIQYQINGQPLDIGERVCELVSDRYRVSLTMVNEGFGFFIQDLVSKNITYAYKQLTTVGSSHYYMLSGDSLLFGSDRLLSFNIPKLIEEGELISFSTVKSSSFLHWLWIFLLVPIGWMLYKKFKPRNLPGSTPKFYDELVSRKGHSYTGEQLNELFGIEHLSYDQVRKRRSAIVQSINDFHYKAEGKALISRLRDEADKRHIIYQVE